jgi:hypothetical protein
MDNNVQFCTDGNIPQCCLELSYNLFDITENCSNENAVQIKLLTLDDNHCGWAWQQNEEKIIYIDPICIGPDLNVIIAHEFGHLYGYDHTNGGCDLMQLSGPDQSCSTLLFNNNEYEKINYCE